MLPDLWTLAVALAVVSGGPDDAVEDVAKPSALQAKSTGEPEPGEPEPGEPEPSAPEAVTEPAPSPTAPTTELTPTPTDGSEPASSPSVGAFPDAEPTDPDATDPNASELPPAAEPRTWNDPTAAVAAAEASPTPAPAPVPDLDDKPLDPMPKKDPQGFGMTMVGAITFSPQSGHAWAEGGCPVANIQTDMGNIVYAPGCTATPAAGISAEGRLGYMINFIGFELYGQLATDYVNARLSDIPPIPGVPDYATQMHLGRIGIGGGGHVRFKTAPGAFRLSAGAGGGFLVRAVFSNVSSLDGSSENYVAPVLRADVGIVVVSALTFGIMGWLEFANTVTITPDLSALGGVGDALQGALTETVVMRGTQGFVGVYGGFAFGK